MNVEECHRFPDTNPEKLLQTQNEVLDVTIEDFFFSVDHCSTLKFNSISDYPWVYLKIDFDTKHSAAAENNLWRDLSLCSSYVLS